MKKLTFALTLLLAVAVAGQADAALVTFSESFLGTTGDGVQQAVNRQTYSFVFDLAASDNYYFQLPAGAQILPTTDASGFIPADILEITSVSLYYGLNYNSNAINSLNMVTGSADGGLSVENFSGAPLGRGQHAFSALFTFSPADFTWLDDDKLEVTVNSSQNIRLDQLRLEVQAMVADPPQPVPLPSAAWLFGAGLIGMVGIKRKCAA
jgi:hypothetical protein